MINGAAFTVQLTGCRQTADVGHLQTSTSRRVSSLVSPTAAHPDTSGEYAEKPWRFAR
jgi:hypothetical protein